LAVARGANARVTALAAAVAIGSIISAAYDLAPTGTGNLIILSTVTRRRALKFIFSLSAGERIIIPTIVITMAENYRDVSGPRCAISRIWHKSTGR